MPFDARIFQVFIASPGDVDQERKIIADVIHEWNYVNAEDRGVVLLPLRWETHASPDMSAGPQAVINRQVVDHCDMAVGVFWTRLGTPTPDAESGTADEIHRVGSAGKPVMLYFSRSKVDLDTIDLEEYGRLRQFKQRTYPNGLVESYSSLTEFRNKLVRHLAITIYSLIKKDSQGAITRETPLSLAMALGEQAEPLRDPSTLQLTMITCTNIDAISEISDPPSTSPARSGSRARIPNPEYVRDLVDYCCKKVYQQPLALGLTNQSEKAIRDVYIELTASVLHGDAKFLEYQPPTEMSRHAKYLPYEHRVGDSGQETRGSTTVTGDLVMGNHYVVNYPSTQNFLRLEELANGGWSMKWEAPLVHTTRTVYASPSLVLDGIDGTVLLFDGTVYSSDLPPFSLQLEATVVVQVLQMSFKQILANAGKDAILADIEL